MDNRGLFGEHDVKKNCMKKEPGDYCMKAGNFILKLYIQI